MYVKIFAGILKSSIAADTPLRRFFMDLLLIADQEGNVIATRDAIAKDLGIPRSEVDWGLERLMQPDNESGNPENEGRRLVAIEGRGYGWTILNYGFYRDVKTAAELRSANARRQAEFKARHRASNASNDEVTLPNKSNPSSSCSDSPSEPISKAEQKPKKERRAKRAALVPMPDGFEVSDRVRAWAEGYGFSQLDKHLEHFQDQARARAYVYADWDAALMNAIRKDWAGLRTTAAAQTPKPKTGKNVQAMHTLEAMKNGRKQPDPGSHATFDLPRIGGAAIGGTDRRDSSDLAGEARALSFRTPENGV